MQVRAIHICLLVCLPFLLLGQVNLREKTAVWGQKKYFSPGITSPPVSPVRSMAEWEELQSIAIAYNRSWKEGHLQALRDIAREAQTEVEVIIICELARDTTDFVEMGISLDNLRFVPVGPGKVEQIWIRDFGPHSVYTNNVDSLLFIDWIYEPDWQVIDTVASIEMANYYDIPLHLTTTAPLDLRMDGGNFLSDGIGRAFSSSHVLEDNPSSQSQIEDILLDFMGVSQYVILDRLEYDVIHHVDMYMKLLDEETLLIGEYPEGISDWERLESNIAYIEEYLKTPFGNSYQIERMMMPPDVNGAYPEGPITEGEACGALNTACYNTYINALFVNKKILVPTYEDLLHDQAALDRWEELMPGYEIVGINCSGLIPEYGAIHCVTKEIGTYEPIWIVHEKIKEACSEAGGYLIEANIEHRIGIEAANVYYRTATSSSFEALEMEQLEGTKWQALIPEQDEGAVVSYYIATQAITGKTVNRPLPAPSAFWSFEVENCTLTNTEEAIRQPNLYVSTPFPNPTQEDLQFTLELHQRELLEITLQDVTGRPVQILFKGTLPMGSHQLSYDISSLSNGLYFLQLQTTDTHLTHKILLLK